MPKYSNFEEIACAEKNLGSGQKFVSTKAFFANLFIKKNFGYGAEFEQNRKQNP